MRTLAKPPKTKKIQKEGQKQSQKKAQSKKITKTVFSSPFCYKIQTLSHEDVDELRSDFLPYLKQIRQNMPLKSDSNVHKKFISFKQQQNGLATLTSPQLVVGVRSCIKALNNEKQRPQLVVVFYEENRQQLLQELLCRLLKEKIPIILARNDRIIQDEMAMKTVTCVGLRNSSISQRLLKLTTRCSVEIPWLVEKKWIGLANN